MSNSPIIILVVMISRDALLKPVGERVAQEVQRKLSKRIGKSLTRDLHTHKKDLKQEINKQNLLYIYPYLIWNANVMYCL